METTFNFAAFSGVKSGQKTSTSTPILSAKGSINISIEAFDQDGEVSPKRATVKV